MCAENSEHASQGLGSAPEQLIAHGKCAEKFGPEIQLVEAADGNVERSRNGRGCEAANGGFFIIGDHAYPGVCRSEHLLDFQEWNVFP